MDYVVDTSAVIEKVVSRLIKEDKLKGSVLIPNAVVAELENQANYGHEIGFVGLEELQEIQELVKKDKIKMEFIGKRPTESQIKFAKSGEIDALIRELAFSKNATLITADRVQAASAKVYGINVHFLEKKKLRERLEIERFFDPITMSIHLKENCVPRAKKGKPGDWKLVEIKKRKLDSKRIQSMAKEIVEKARIDPSSFIEISRRGSTIVQYRDYRIIIVKPPVSDGWEITVVRPIKKLQIKDYKIPDEIFSRIAKKAAGIIIAGETGSGKCLPSGTKIYLKNNIIKTIENAEIGDEILSYNKTCKIEHSIITKKFKRLVNKTLRVATNFGKEIELTPEHPILSFKEGTPKWIEAKELVLGDRIATVRRLPSEGELQEIDWVNLLPEDIVLVKIKKNTKIEMPIEETFYSVKRKIIEAVKNKKECKLRDIYKELKSSSSRISSLLPKLVKDGILKRKNQPKNYSYSLNKKNLRLKKGSIVPLKALKKYLTCVKIYDIAGEISKFDTWHISSFIKPPRYTTKELCELLGYYIGESLTKYGISCDSRYCRDRFKELSKSIFNIEVNKSNKGRYDIYTDEYGSIELFLNRCFNISLLKSKKRATNHEIPYPILKSPKIELASFLRAYFDTECYIDDYKGIEISSASKNLIKQTQLALLRFNIQSSTTVKIIKNKPYHFLFIYRHENIKRFKEEIGLIEKSRQLNRYLNNSEKGSPNKDTIPVGYLLNRVNKRERLRIKYPFLKRDFSHEQANKMILLMSPKVEEITSIIELTMIKMASSDYIQWDTITKIIEIKEEKEVYDIEVKDTHNFLAGDVPFLVHNSTFAEALAEFHSLSHKIVKTVESPRDLKLIDEITQYSKNFASSEEIHDILFLSRPDYIIFDEMRTTPDFNLYVDLRLAGSSVIGVLHSASPIDAVQRFITRIDTGMIPSIVDTILFIEAGAISRILTLNMIVKVPSGMTEADLARPVVEVFDFFNNKLLYEIYSYGEETVVVPVQQTETAVTILAQKQLEGEIKKYCREAKIELISNDRAIVYVPEREIPRIIGKQGKRIESIEKSIGIKITVKELRRPTKFDVSENPNYIVLHVNKGLTNKSLNISIENEFLTSAIVGNKGEIRINKRSEIGKTLLNALDHKERITLE